MTSTLTTTTVLDLTLPSGTHGAVVYAASFGDITLALLLACVLALQILQIWRSRRGAS